MNGTFMDNPAAVMQRLADIEEQMSRNQNDLELAARTYFELKRWRDVTRAKLLLGQQGGTVDERNARALTHLSDGENTAVTYAKFIEAEANYEALKLAQRSLSDRATIGQSILRAQNVGSFGRPQRDEWAA